MFFGRQIQRVVFFAMLAGLAYVLWARYREKPAPVQPDAFTRGYAATGVMGKISNAQGEFVVRFQADELIQYDHSDNIEIRRPTVWFHDKKTPQWQFQAVSGRFDRRGQRLFFDQQVKMENRPRLAQEKIHLQTSRLWIEPDARTARTAEKVTLTGQGVGVTAIGAEFDLGNNRHHLLSHVQMEYHESN